MTRKSIYKIVTNPDDLRFTIILDTTVHSYYLEVHRGPRGRDELVAKTGVFSPSLTQTIRVVGQNLKGYAANARELARSMGKPLPARVMTAGDVEVIVKKLKKSQFATTYTPEY